MQLKTRSIGALVVIACLGTQVFGQKKAQADLGYRTVKTIKKSGLLFKDLNKNGKLDKYEDWRLPAEIRAKDLVSKMTLEQKVGMMLISTTRMAGDNSSFGGPSGPLTSEFNESDMVLEMNMFTRKPLPFPLIMASGTSQAIDKFHLRHFIMRANTPAATMAEWANNLQAACEAAPLGIPALVASNPRNHLTIDAAVGLSVGNTAFTQWPGELGLAAMRDMSLTRAFAETAAKEWAAVGLRKGYMYMADLATEPRWQRIEGTFGEDADLSAAMMTEVVLGFQNGKKLNSQSVALTTKHFPGGGPQVRGHDPHFVWGQDQHYPGGMFDYHLKPFQAAIDAGTSSIMPYYAKPIDPALEPVAFAYNKAIIQDLLRGKMGFKGIINSDTGPIEMMPWGVEQLSIKERYAKAVTCGVDLFSGSADPAPLLETIQDGLITESRINESVIRLLVEKFDLGIFENPYVDVAKASEIVGSKAFQEKADLAQRKSIVLLRNKNNLLPLKTGQKVCLMSYFDKGKPEEASQILMPESTADITYVSSPEEADVVVLWLTPSAGGLFGSTEAEIELQLSKNKIDVALVNQITYHKPTVMVINFTRPWVLDEVDNPNVSTMLATFGASKEALLDVLTGKFNPTGKMPISIPISKKAVLENDSDVPGYLEKQENYLFRFGDGLSY